MKLAFISYWGVNEGLTQATVLPHLEYLNSKQEVDEIVFLTIERKVKVEVQELYNKVKHIPVYEDSKIPGMKQFFSLRKISKKLELLKPDLVFARSSLAAIPAYHYNKKTAKPYVVESFEPHAAYMLDAGEWSKGGIKYKLLKKYESKEVQTALFILPVSENYRKRLISDGVNDDRVITLPCTVDMELFSKNEKRRLEIRQQLGWDKGVTVGVYLGKFGGLYEEEKAFEYFNSFLSKFDDFRMLVLSPEVEKIVFELANKVNFPIDKLEVSFVDHKDVPDYLSASDIAFATYKNTPSNKYLSPIKVGEYLSNGLFVVIMDGVGDDAEQMSRFGVGVKISEVEDFLSVYKEFTPDKARKYASEFRSRKLVHDSYDRILKEAMKNNRS